MKVFINSSNVDSMVGLWLPHSNCWEKAWRYVMREMGDSVRSDERLGDTSPVGLESESDGDGIDVETYITPPVWSGPSDAGAGLQVAPVSPPPRVTHRGLDSTVTRAVRWWSRWCRSVARASR